MTKRKRKNEKTVTFTPDVDEQLCNLAGCRCSAKHQVGVEFQGIYDGVLVWYCSRCGKWRVRQGFLKEYNENKEDIDAAMESMNFSTVNKEPI